MHLISEGGPVFMIPMLISLLIIVVLSVLDVFLSQSKRDLPNRLDHWGNRRIGCNRRIWWGFSSNSGRRAQDHAAIHLIRLSRVFCVKGGWIVIELEALIFSLRLYVQFILA